MSYDNDVYHSPEKFGLTLVGEVEYSDGAYQFDTTIVLRHNETGRIYAGHDSGCSCPSPFDGVGIDELVTFSKPQELLDYLNDGVDTYYSDEVERVKGEVAEVYLKATSGKGGFE